MKDLHVSIIQDDLDWQDPKANRIRHGEHIRSLPNTDLIVLPETFNTGFSMHPWILAETMGGETVAWMRAQAASSGAVITGSLVIEEGGKYKNRMVWATPDGSVCYYDKRHLFRFGNEHMYFTGGNRRVIVGLNGWRIALFVCYDLRFPVWCRNRGDYDVAIYVANWPNARQYAWDMLLKSRAIENQVYVVGVNRTGCDEIGNDFSGGSVVCDFLGKPIVDCGGRRYSAGIGLCKAGLDEFRRQFPAALDADDFELLNADHGADLGRTTNIQPLAQI